MLLRLRCRLLSRPPLPLLPCAALTRVPGDSRSVSWNSPMQAHCPVAAGLGPASVSSFLAPGLLATAQPASQRRKPCPLAVPLSPQPTGQVPTAFVPA